MLAHNSIFLRNYGLTSKFLCRDASCFARIEKPKKLTIEIQHAAWFFLAIAGFFLSRVGYSVGIDGVDEDFVCELAHK